MFFPILAAVLLGMLLLHVVLHPLRSLGCIVEVVVGSALFVAAFVLIANLVSRR
jgi:hypothetical protein